jgi:hypothetical protein
LSSILAVVVGYDLPQEVLVNAETDPDATGRVDMHADPASLPLAARMSPARDSG